MLRNCEILLSQQRPQATPASTDLAAAPVDFQPRAFAPFQQPQPLEAQDEALSVFSFVTYEPPLSAEVSKCLEALASTEEALVSWYMRSFQDFLKEVCWRFCFSATVGPPLMLPNLHRYKMKPKRMQWQFVSMHKENRGQCRCHLTALIFYAPLCLLYWPMILSSPLRRIQPRLRMLIAWRLLCYL